MGRDFCQLCCIQERIRTGQDNYRLKPVYIVSIDTFALHHRAGWDGSILSSYSLREDRTHELMTDSLPEGSAEGIWAKLAQQSELAEMPGSESRAGARVIGNSYRRE